MRESQITSGGSIATLRRRCVLLACVASVLLMHWTACVSSADEPSPLNARPEWSPTRPVKSFQIEAAVDDTLPVQQVQHEIIDVQPVVVPRACVSCSRSGCSGCRRRSRFWIQADYLLWNLSGFDTPVLISSSPAGTPQNVAGVLGQPTTSTLFGGGEMVDQSRSGMQLQLGVSLDGQGRRNIEFDYFWLDSVSDSITAGGDNAQIVARPFFSVEPTAVGQNAEFVHLPGILDGTISAAVSSDFRGGSLIMRQALAASPRRSLSIFGGIRHLDLDDDVVISDFRTALDASRGLAVGTTLAETDRFATNNQFTGVVVGADLRGCHRRWTIDMSMQMAFGATDAQAMLAGSTTATVPVAGGTDVTTTNTGLLVLGSNRGTFSTDDFAMIPQVGVDLKYHLTPHWSAHVGYDFIYWSRVARAGDLIDADLNLSQLAPTGLNGLERPRFDWQFTDLVINAFNAGLNFQY